MVLFEGKASHTESTWELLLSLLGALFFAGLLIAAFFVEKLGSPLYYLVPFLLSVVSAWWFIRRSGVVVRLVRDEGGGHRIEVKGRAHDISMSFDFDYAFWYNHQDLKTRQGGYTMVRYNLLAVGRDGRRLGFQMEGGRGGGEPEMWERREENIPDGREVFRMMGLVALLHAIQEAERIKN